MLKKILIKLLLYFSVITLVFGSYFYLNNLLVIGLDTSSQYVPFLNDFYSILKGQDSFLYNFNFGMGESYIPHFAYYIGSPISILFVLLSRGNILNVINILMITKLTLMALSMDVLLDNIKTDNRNIILALSYALSGYVVTYVEFHNWLDVMIYLPLFILIINKWLEGKKSYLWIPLISALVFLSNYVFAAYFFLFIGIYFVYQCLYLKVSFVKIVQYFIWLVLYSFVGLMLVLPIILPTLTFMLSGSGKVIDNEIQNSFLNPSVQNILSAFFNSFSSLNVRLNEYGSPNLYIGIFALLLVPYAFKMKNRIKSQLNFMFFVLIISPFIFSFIDSIFNFMYQPIGFPYRYSFIAIFSLLYLAKLGMDQYSDNIDWSNILIVLIALILVFIQNFNENKYVVALLALNLFIILMLKWIYSSKRLILLLYVLIMADLGFNFYFSSNTLHGEAESYRYYTKNMESYHYQSYPILDTSVNKIYTDFNKSNGILFNRNSSSVIFSSSLNIKQNQIANLLNINNAGLSLVSLSGRESINDLFGIEYILFRNNKYLPMHGFEIIENIGTDDIYLNKQFYTKGFIANKYILQSDFEKLPLYVRDLIMIDAVITIDPINSLQEVEIQDYTDIIFEEIVDEDFEFSSKKIYYVKTDGEITDLKLLVNNEPVYQYRDQFHVLNYHKIQSFYLNQVFYLGVLQKNMVIQGLDLEGMSVYSISIDDYDKIIQNHQNDIQYSKIGNEINIKTSKDGVWVSTLPFDDGWKTENKKTITHGAMLGVYVDANQEITMSFEPRGMIIGIICALISLVAYIIFIAKSTLQNHSR